MSQSPTQTEPDLETTTPYPPCLFTTPEEKKLYARLREVYTMHSHSWDAETCSTWPVIVEHASLAPSTVGKITNHSITRHMINKGVTWAHVVALRVIYKTQLYKSRKIMKLIREKYPRANFNSFAYSKEYKSPIKAEIPGGAKGTAAQKSPSVNGGTHGLQGEGDLLLRETCLAGNPEVSRAVNEFLDEEDFPEAEEEARSPYFTRKKLSPVTVKDEEKEGGGGGGREQYAKLPDFNGNQPLLEPASRRRKRAASKAMRDEDEAESRDVCKKIRCTPFRVGGDTSGLSTLLDDTPDSSKEEPDGFAVIFKRLSSALSENTRAVRENTGELRNLLRGTLR
ncbi:hypothetical protein V8C37DRAFT_378693 [Trichoderma ceciliae]